MGGPLAALFASGADDTMTARRNRLTTVILVGALLIAVQALTLVAIGHPLICKCGFVTLWYGSPSGPQTSQQLADWYSFTHIEHGFLFYLLLWAIAPRMRFGTRLLFAMGIEIAWEIAENTPWVINRYRQSALAEGYFGDSVVNSLMDTVSMMTGAVIARLSPVWLSAGLVIGTELVLLFLIRDNLALNIVQLLHPMDWLSRWQAGG